MIYFTLTVLTMSVSRFAGFDIKLHPQQKCFDDLCIPYCVDKQAADMSRFDFFFKMNRKNFKSQMELRSFESNL